MRNGFERRLIFERSAILTICQTSPRMRCGWPSMMSSAPTLTTLMPLPLAALMARF